MDEQLAVAQTLKYAEELRRLYAEERTQRRRAEDAFARLNESYANTVRALSAALELRDDVTGGHARRVTRLALQLTEAAASELLSDPELEYAYLLHDIGKIGVPDAILLKPGRLDAREMDLMRQHTVLGDHILAGIPHLGGVTREVVASHHERWDGTGYPQGLRGEEIPLAARIFAIADAFDAMTNDRPYRRALPFEAAAAEIEQGAGSQFDPALVLTFLSLLPALREAA